jgi:hypothetical protein
MMDLQPLDSKSNGWRSIIPFIIIIIITFEGDCHLFNHYLVWADEFTIKLTIYMILKGGGSYFLYGIFHFQTIMVSVISQFKQYKP